MTLYLCSLWILMSSSEVGDCCWLTPFWELYSAKGLVDGNFNWFRVCLLMEWLHKRLQASKAQVEWALKIPANTVMVQNTELPRQDAWSGSACSTAAVLRRLLPCDVYSSTVNYQVGGACRVTRRPPHSHAEEMTRRHASNWKVGRNVTRRLSDKWIHKIWLLARRLLSDVWHQSVKLAAVEAGQQGLTSALAGERLASCFTCQNGISPPLPQFILFFCHFLFFRPAFEDYV